MELENVKSEKAKALNRYQSFRGIFRITEIFVALLFVFWVFTCLPFAVRISGEFLRRLACVVSTPLFMFVLGNSIVVALLTTKSSGGGGAETDIYDAFIRSGENRVGDLTEEIIVYDEKQMIATATDSFSNSNSNPTAAREYHAIIETDKDSNSVSDSPTKIYRRSKSEISTKQSLEIATKPSLRRSETDKCRKIVESCEEVPFPEDNLTNEEFQKKIEAFIAKELILRRRESLALVIHNQI